MLKDTKKLRKKIAKYKLSISEKTEMRSALLNFIQNNPITVKNKLNRHMLSQGSLVLNLLRSKPMVATLIMAFVLAVSGGTSLAAEQSLPGDLLYPVKINVNETVRSAVNLSTEAKVDWETKKIERRLEEFEKLKIENRLTANTTVGLQNAIEVQSDKVDRLIQKFKDHDKEASTHSQLEAVLKSHSQILILLSDSNAAVADVALDMAQKTKAAADNRVEAEEKLSTESTARIQVAAEGKMKAAENKIAEVKKFLNRKANRLNTEVKTQAQTTLQAAEQAWAEGKVNFEAAVYSEAFAGFQEVIRLAQEAKITASMSDKLNLKLNAHTPQSTSTDATVEIKNKTNIHTRDRARIDSLINQANQIRNRIKENLHQQEDKIKDQAESDRNAEEQKTELDLELDTGINTHANTDDGGGSDNSASGTVELKIN